MADLYGRIEDYVAQYAREFYGGNVDAGFRHWAFSETFLEYGLSDEEVRDRTAIDGPDDFEVDGYYIEETEEQKVVHLFQCKHDKPGTSVRVKDYEPFWKSLERVLDPEQIVVCRNEETKTLHDELSRVLPQGFAVHMVWVSSGTLSPQSRIDLRDNRSLADRELVIAGVAVRVRVELEAYGLKELVDLFQSHLDGEDLAEPIVTLKVDPKRCHVVQGDYKVLQATIPVGEIIKAFRLHRFKIFRLNPRGPLGNKTNAGIRRTLEDPTLRRMFHLLNNGLSAICDSFRTIGESAIEARDFQIVNGCQTTVTLWSARALVENDPYVLVNFRLIECPQHLHRNIANATNVQSPLGAEDFISTDPVQEELQRQFRALSPRWFYEVKRGEWSKMVVGVIDKDEYRDIDGAYRRLKSIDVAQYTLSFLGFPGEAKDKIRFFLADQLDVKYHELYSKITAAQLLLPAIVYRRVISAVQQAKAAGVAPEWLEYARLHVLWLIGELIRGHYKFASGLLPRDRSVELSLSAEQWFPGLYRVALTALNITVAGAVASKTYGGHREFFRSASHYPTITGNLSQALQIVRDAGLEPHSRLP